MTQATNQLRAALYQHKLSITHARTAVFTALQNGGPLTMHELIKNCGATVDRASVYRTVALFERLGIIQRIQIGWKYRIELSDTFQHHHHHLHCIHCGSITALPEDPELEKRLQSLFQASGFAAEDHTLEVRGVCRNCRVNKKDQLIRPGKPGLS
jgi:Fe2+ or Zn2+ uptake regulation protein